ncbi:MAG: putative nucleotidyltransferase substrate binding domain-containing protein [Kiloniellales bacterium]|nr:putative nucleotidyltransferase substrate binding domain-containing protein [Kiloniellales bacterium]
MVAELSTIRDYLADCHPFSLLDAADLGALCAAIQVVREKRGAILLEPGQKIQSLYLVRSGAVEIKTSDGELLMQIGDGEAFGVRAMLGDGTAPNEVSALEDIELYLIPRADFLRLRKAHTEFADYFVPMKAGEFRRGKPWARARAKAQFGLMSLTLRNLLEREPITIERGTTLRDAAKLMRQHDISCLPVVEGEELVGILTTGDLRDRVVAEGLDVEGPVDSVMTSAPVTLDAESAAFDALLTMTQRGISHLPVTDKGRLAGIITNTNLVRQQTQSAVFMVGDIARRVTHDQLAEVVAQVPKLLMDLVESGATADSIGHIVTSICDATTRRLLTLAERELGPPPLPYVWLASGSQARQEQTGVSDQDNCMVIDDGFDPALHGDYFKSLATRVCDGLNACGYVYCPGEMMAMTDKWRQPLSRWQKYFASWIDEPEPMAQMLTSVMFDLRPIWGETGLFEALHDQAVAKAKSNSIFLAHLVSNALTHTPPLGFFRNFVLIRGGEHKHRFDLKHSGVVPVIDIARVYALAAGIKEVNTRDRLLAEREASALSKSGAQDLLDVFEFISITRLKHQARQIRDGRAPDNFMSPEDLSHFERNHLKDAFDVVKTIQSSMANAYHVGTL